MIIRHLEKEFDIKLIASFVENKVLVVLDKNYTANKRRKIMEQFESDLLDFCSFITGENINFTNISLYAPTIKSILAMQYPNMRYKLMYFDEYKSLSDKDINNCIEKYKELYGESIKIKSIKKEIVKTLKKRDK